MQIFLIAMGLGMGIGAIQGGIIESVWAVFIPFTVAVLVAWFGGKRAAYASAVAKATAQASAMAAAAARSQSTAQSASSAAVHLHFDNKETRLIEDVFVAPSQRSIEQEKMAKLAAAYDLEDAEELFSKNPDELVEKLEEGA